MTVVIDVTGGVAGMVVVLARDILLTGGIAVAVLIDVTGGVAGMVVVLARDVLLSGGIAMAVLIEVAGGVAGMVVVLAGLFFLHRFSPANVPNLSGLAPTPR